MIMDQAIPANTFRHLVDSLKRPSPPSESKPYWPYPLPEAEMIARYGLRRLTPDERLLFPGLRLVLQISKVQLTKPPAVMPMARAGWVVWIAETYRGHYLVRFPGGATLLAPFNEMSWTAVADDVPASTLFDAKIAEHQRHWRTAVLVNIHQQLHL
jgi:hypothetical protein